MHKNTYHNGLIYCIFKYMHKVGTNDHGNRYTNCVCIYINKGQMCAYACVYSDL